MTSATLTESMPETRSPRQNSGMPARASVEEIARRLGVPVAEVERLVATGVLVADGDGLHPVQQAFHEQHALQCGYCTAGMVMSVKELLHRNPKPTVEDIKDGIEGNFCRCTGYQQIIEAVQDVTGQLSKKGELEHA